MVPVVPPVDCASSHVGRDTDRVYRHICRYSISCAGIVELTWVCAWCWGTQTAAAALRDSCSSLNSHQPVLPLRVCRIR